jgi:hypothetical protein
MALDERQGVPNRGLMGPFNRGRHRRISDRPEGRHRLHRGERQVITRDRLGPGPRVLGDLSSQLSGIHRLPAMLGQEELTGHRGPHPCPIRGRQRRVGWEAGCRIDRRDASGHLEPERADDTIDDLERRAQLGHFLEVTWSEVRPFQPLLAELGQRMQTTAEQRSHLLRGHRVTGGQAVDPDHAGANPHPRRLTPLGVVRRQAGMTLLGRIQGCDLPGQIVITGSSSELVDAHRHTHPKGVHTAGAVRPTRALSHGASGVWHIES